MAKRAAKTKKPTLAELVLEWEAERRKGKSHYEAADRAFQRVLAQRNPGESITLPDGRSYVIVDNFVDKDGQPKNKAFSVAGVERYSLKELK